MAMDLDRQERLRSMDAVVSALREACDLAESEFVASDCGLCEGGGGWTGEGEERGRQRMSSVQHRPGCVVLGVRAILDEALAIRLDIQEGRS